ncbi:hypothetical protein GON01_02385 [Sphingomonas sp. MAH-20]|uniref:Uncharacterized protein n=1 Tax=Sphingomonas horti TaxID=2682842 RepID=A0A6I4IXD3_9SPHN|nr:MULTISPECIES: hypothetical protein [Sphingomonas]MBA2920537.1 hypothetical protein [Sphingomonas sp. CGMCC 1.13658]MVO76789.1 hypothetical protein [Sphingomonas horti]
MREEWRKEAEEAVRREDWALNGPKRIVKVTPLDRGIVGAAGGYITLAKFLNGKTPQEVEKELGLPLGFLASGMVVSTFARLPMSSEYEYELTAKFPGGLYYNKAYSDENYPPGSNSIHQWKIREGVQIPIDKTKTVSVLPRTIASL